MNRTIGFAVLFLLWCGGVFAQIPLTGHGVSTRLACASTTGAPSSTVYACSTTPSFTPVANDIIEWVPGSNDLSNTGPTPTINVNALGAKPIVSASGAVTALDAGDVGRVTAVSRFTLVYDGTNWQLLSQSGNAASTFTNTANQALDAFYAGLRKTNTQIVRIGGFVDSILTCYQIAPCNFGPFSQSNSPMWALRTELCKQFLCWSSGIRPIYRITGTTTPDGGEGGYVLTSGTLGTSTLIGPQETTPPANFSGTSLASLTSGGVLTITVGQAWSKVIIYCATNSTSTGWTPTIGGAAQANVCTAQPGAATANAVTITNPTSIATQGATPSTLTFTSLGNNSFIYGYEALFTNGTNGLVIDNMGVGAISAVWFGAPSGLAWWDLTQGVVGLCIMEFGENDAQGGTPRSVANFNADAQVIATDCGNRGGSNLFWIPPPFSGPGANYTNLQAGILAYSQTAGWDVLIMNDLFRGGNLVLRGAPDFVSQSAAALSALNQTDGTLASDNQHPSDVGSWNLFQQIYSHLFGRIPAPQAGYGVGSQMMNRAMITPQNGAYTNATTGATSIVGWTWTVYKGQTLKVECDGDYQAAATGGLRMQITGPAMTAMKMNLWGGLSQTTSFNPPTVTATATLTTGTAITTATTNFPWRMSLYVNPSANGTVQIQAASVAAVNLTIGVGSTCSAQ